MAFEPVYFQAMEGGYPHAANGSTAAITNDTNVFYIDEGKTVTYGDMMVSDLTGFLSISADTEITGLEIVIEDAGYLGAIGGSTVDIEIYHQSTGGYSNTISPLITNPQDDSPQHILVGGSSEKWGKEWILSDLTHSNFRVHVDNPIEPSPVEVALVGTFIYLKVHYGDVIPSISSLQLHSGKIQLHSGKILIH